MTESTGRQKLGLPGCGLRAGNTLQAGDQRIKRTVLQLIHAAQGGYHALAHLAVLTPAFDQLQILPGAALLDACVHGTTLCHRNIST